MGLVPALLTGQPFSHIRANEPFGIDSAVYDAGGDTLTAQVGNGRVRWGDTTFELSNTGAYTTAVTVTPVAASTTYYVVMDYAAGTPVLSFTTVVPAPTSSADFTYIGYVTVDGTKAVTDIVDLRGLLTPTNPRASFGTAAVPAYSFADDPDTGIYHGGTNQLGITTAGTSKLLFGDTNILVESGVSLRIDDGTAALPGLGWRADPDTGFFRIAEGDTGYSANGTERVRFDDAGLKVNSGDQNTPGYSFLSNPDTGMFYRAAGSGDAGSIAFTIDTFRVWEMAEVGGESRLYGTEGNDYIANNPTSEEWTFGLNSTEFFKINTAGVIVVGDLSVSSNIISPSGGLAVDAQSGGDLVFRTNGVNRMYYDDSIDYWRIFGGTTEVVRIYNNALEMESGGQIRGASGSAGAPAFAFNSNANYGMFLEAATIQFSRAGQVRMSIGADWILSDPEGNAEIVYDESLLSLRPFTDAGNNLGTSGVRWATTYTDTLIETSDANKKTNIQDIGFGLDFLRALRPVSYEWINGSSGRPHTGVIAQEVKQVMDDMNMDWGGYQDSSVNIKDDDPEPGMYDVATYGIGFSELWGPAIKAIQELADRLDVLESA
jgi:hypothetical protein